MNLEPIDPELFNGLSLDLVMRELITEINDIKTVLLMDQLLRERNPVLQDAYEQYQTVKI